MVRGLQDEAVLLIGLGRFGTAMAEQLEAMGTQVMAIDPNPELVQEWSGRLTHVVQADATNPEALQQLGCRDFKVAVVAIGTGVEASVLTTSVLVDFGIPEIWAKAISIPHGRILERIGAAHVVYPERDAGTRVARLLSHALIDFTEIGDGFAIAKMRAGKDLDGKTVAETHLRSEKKLSIIAHKSSAGAFATATDESLIRKGDLLIVAGPSEQVEQYAAND